MPGPTVRSVRDFVHPDLDACVGIMQSNTPLFFTGGEVGEYAAWLAARTSPYLVVVEDEVVVACGGYRINRPQRTAGLTWGMVRRDRQRAGLGALLLTERLDRIRADGGASTVILDTSQHSRGFFERYGFQPSAEQQDGYGGGLDRVDMQLAL